MNSSDTQAEKAYKLLKKRGKKGVSNYEFPQRGLLRYSQYIKILRDEYGCNILVERLYLPNGRASNVYKYYLLEEAEQAYLDRKRG